jgi:hypothetical protein
MWKPDPTPSYPDREVSTISGRQRRVHPPNVRFAADYHHPSPFWLEQPHSPHRRAATGRDHNSRPWCLCPGPGSERPADQRRWARGAVVGSPWSPKDKGVVDPADSWCPGKAASSYLAGNTGLYLSVINHGMPPYIICTHGQRRMCGGYNSGHASSSLV